MTSVPITAATAAAILGPFTLVVARRRMHAAWTPTLAEITACTTALGVLVAFVLHGSRPAAVLIPLLLLGPAAAIVDIREGRLPDLLTGPLFGATLLTVAAAGTDGMRAIAAAAMVTAVAALIAALAADVLGWGDVKLIPTLAIVLGHQNALLAGLALVVVLVGVTAVVVGFQDRRSVVPYGPALVLGTIGAVAGF